MIIFQEFCSDPLWNQTNTTIIGISSSKYNNWMKRTKKRITWNSCLNFNSHKNGKIKFVSFFFFLLKITKQTNELIRLFVSQWYETNFIQFFFSFSNSIAPLWTRIEFQISISITLFRCYLFVCLFVCRVKNKNNSHKSNLTIICMCL